MIPRLLHQTFRSPRPLSPQLEACLKTNAELNPDWEHRYYDDRATEEVIESVLGHRFIDRYRRIDPYYGAVKADVFRYACIYQFGGCYLDIKSICTRPLSAVLRNTDECILSKWDTNRFPGWGVHRELNGIAEIQQWFIIAIRKSPLIEAALHQATSNLERYRYLRDGFGQIAVLRITGPIAFTKAVVPLLERHNHRFVDSATDLGLQYDGFATIDVRLEVTGKNYRDAVRPLIIPLIVPSFVHPLYFAISDAAADCIRKVLRLYRSMK